MDFQEVSSLLWKERNALELLLFKLVEEQLIISAAQTRWLSHADREIEVVLEDLRATEVLRALAVDSLAEEAGHAGTPLTLRELADLAPEPWATMLLDHRKALQDLIASVEQVKNDNRGMLIANERAIRQLLLADDSDRHDMYTATGAASSTRRLSLMDEQA
jgi:hypothetical protein